MSTYSSLIIILVGLTPPSSGRVVVDGIDVSRLDRAGWKAMRRRVQMVFQDPFGSLNPRLTIGTAIRRPIQIHGIAKGPEVGARVQHLLARVGLRPEHASRYPHELSGGQQQRVGIARALAVSPALTILDEPTSALDVSVQAQILAQLRLLQKELRLTFLFISHDLSVVRALSTRIAVLYRGRLMEIGPAQELVEHPCHPYTRLLLGSVPEFNGRRIPPPPRVPLIAGSPGGCVFFGRCARRLDRCGEAMPALAPVRHEGHTAACFNPYGEE